MMDDDKNNYAGFWLRLIAFIIDSLWLTLLISPLLSLFGLDLVLGTSDLGNPDQLSDVLKTSLSRLSIEGLAMLIAFMVMWHYLGSSPGKMLFKAYIVDFKTGGKPTTSQLVVRYLGYYLSLIPLGLGFLWIGWQPQKRGWHDLMAGTVVVIKKKTREEQP